MNIIISNYDIIKQMADVCKNDKKILNNKTFLKTKKIILFINNSNNLNLDVNVCTLELMLSWILLTFSNKFVSHIFINDKNEWFNIFVICNDFIKIINNFFIYSYEPGYSSIKEDFVSNYELVISILMRLNLNELILKKVDNVTVLNNLLEKDLNKKELEDFFTESNIKNNNIYNHMFDISDTDSDSDYDESLGNSISEKNIFDEISYFLNNNLERLLIKEIPNFSELSDEKKKKIINKFFFNWTLPVKKKKNDYNNLIMKFQEIYIKKFLSPNEVTQLKKLLIKNFNLKKDYEKFTIKKSSLYSLNYNKLKNSKINCDFFQNLNLNISLIKPDIISTINNRYYINTHYLTITKILKENKNSNKVIDLGNIFIFDHLKNIRYFLDEKIYNDFFNKICEFYKLDKNNAKNHLIKNYNFNKSISSKKSQKENSKYYYLIIFLSLKDFPFLFENGFYLSYFFDFRGRFYSSSSISPVGNKIFRYLYTYGNYSKKEIDTASFNFNTKNLIPMFNLIEKNSILSKIYPNWDVSENFVKEIIKQVFFELGKLKKADYIYQYNGRFNEEDLINIGINVFNNYFNEIDVNKIDKIDFEFEIEMTYLLNILSNYYCKKYTKSIIYKDATASAIQLWMYVLNTQNDDNYKICNLTNDGYWYDTYYFIINYFLKNNQISDFSKPFFNRSILKPSIMTYNYSATFWTIKNDIVSKVKKTCFKNNIKYSDKELELLINDVQKFYNYLENFFNTKTFFESPSDKIINYLFEKTDINILLSDGSTASFQYNLREFIILDKIRSLSNNTNKKKQYIELRQKLKILWISDKPDAKKTRQAIRANFIHSLDALLIRLILQELDTAVITIHDSIGVDILNTNKIIKIANKCFNKINFDNNHLSNKIIFYSPYIIL